MLLVAVSLAVFPSFMWPCPTENWIGWLVSVMTLASISVLAAILAAGPRRWLAACTLVVLLPAAASAMFTWFGAELAAILILLLVLIRASIAGRSGRRRTICRVALAAVVLAFAVPLSLVYVRLARRTPHPPQLTFANNHYDGILSIAEAVNRINPQEPAMIMVGPAASKTRAAARLEASYQKLQSLLAGTSGVEYDPDRDDDTAFLADSQSLRATKPLPRRRGGGLDCPRRRGWRRDYALATMQLGAILQRGGSLDHAYNGMNFEESGRRKLAQLRHRLSPAKADQVRSVLAKVASERKARATRVARARRRSRSTPLANPVGERDLGDATYDVAN